MRFLFIHSIMDFVSSMQGYDLFNVIGVVYLPLIAWSTVCISLRIVIVLRRSASVSVIQILNKCAPSIDEKYLIIPYGDYDKLQEVREYIMDLLLLVNIHQSEALVHSASVFFRAFLMTKQFRAFMIRTIKMGPPTR